MDIEDVLMWAFHDEDVEHDADAHPDAVTVYWAVLALPSLHASVIRYFARHALRPDWHPAPGQVVVLSHARRARRLYSEWVRAMAVLQKTLDGALTAVRVTGPSAAEEPWLLERTLAWSRSAEALTAPRRDS